MTEPIGPAADPTATTAFDAAVAALTAALDRHVEQVRADPGDGVDLESSATALARALLDFSLAEQELTGAAAFWPADPEDGAEPTGDGADELSEDGEEADGDEVSVVLRMDFLLSDPAALLAAGDRAAADQDRPDTDGDGDGDPIADAVFAIAHRHGWDSLAADEVPGLDATQLTAQVITPTTDQEP